MSRDLQSRIQAELAAARAARRAGNEGRARVCARRAAGGAARDFLARRGVRIGSDYAAIQVLASRSDLPPDLLASAGRLILRVDEQFGLPPGLDLIAEASRLIERLEQDS
jgi:hypothetical protein